MAGSSGRWQTWDAQPWHHGGFCGAMGVPQGCWMVYIMENPSDLVKWMIQEVPLSWETSIYIDTFKAITLSMSSLF